LQACTQPTKYNIPWRIFGWMLDECTDHPLHGKCVSREVKIAFDRWLGWVQRALVAIGGLDESKGAPGWIHGLDQSKEAPTWIGGLDKSKVALEWTSGLDKSKGSLGWTGGLDKYKGALGGLVAWISPKKH
jgi:hypothetical protein